jgi:hypothetical protein
MRLGQKDGLYKNNKTGVRGLSWSYKDALWYAQPQVNGVRHRKCFKKYDDAVQWIKEIKNITK